MSLEFSSRQTREPLTAIGRYLAEVRSLPLLSQEEESRLAARPAAGDRAAGASLVERHFRLVVGIARHYAGHGLGLEDLIREGNLGLLRAASRFDPRRGVRFATYSAWWVRQHTPEPFSRRRT
jgi:RNA polymerase primary sigma factor